MAKIAGHRLPKALTLSFGSRAAALLSEALLPVLAPLLAQIDMLNWRAFERAIAAGYEYAVGRLEALPADSPLRQA